MVLRESPVVTLLNTELSWNRLPLFFVVQYTPELLDAWLIIVYLRCLGVNWLELGRSFFTDGRFLFAKVTALLTPVLYVINAGINRR